MAQRASSAVCLPVRRASDTGLPASDGERWVTGLAFEAYGVRVGVRVDDPIVLPQIHHGFPHGALILEETAPVVDSLFSLQLHGLSDRAVVYRDDAEWLRSPRNGDLPDLLEMIAVGMKASVTENALEHIFVHAGVVGWNGRAIVIPGQSESGKTTLVEQLVRRGALYYSDDYAVVDREGLVHPFAQPLRRRVPGQPDRNLSTAEELGGVTGETPLPIGLVVACPYVEGTAWAPQPLSRGEGLAMLLHNTRATRKAPQNVIDVLARATEDALFLAGPRGDAIASAGEILRIADSMMR